MPQYGVPEKLTGHTRRAVTAAQHTDAFPRRKLLIGGLNNGQLLTVFQFNRNFKAILLGQRLLAGIAASRAEGCASDSRQRLPASTTILIA